MCAHSTAFCLRERWVYLFIKGFIYVFSQYSPIKLDSLFTMDSCPMAAETHYIKKDSIIKNITSRISYQYILCSFVYGFCHLIFANLTFRDKGACSVRAT